MTRFELSILGCGSAFPTLRHNPSAQALSHRDRVFLVDCGEGTQQHYRRQGLKLMRLQHIFISHLHGDHCLGLVGLISTLGLLDRGGEVIIHAVPDALRIFPPLFDTFCQELPFDVRIEPFSPFASSTIYEDDALTVKTLPLKHRIPAAGFLFEEKEAPRHLLGDMAEYYKIPHYRRAEIKAGADFVLPDGTVVPNSRLTRPAAPPVRYAYCSDTAYNEKPIPLIEGVDLLYHEATFGDEAVAMARRTLHSTARQAGIMARNAHVKQLMIGHFSARYNDEEKLLAEAREEFADTILAREGLKYSF